MCNLDDLLDWYDVYVNSWRSRLNNHRLTQFIICNAIGADDDTVRLGHLGPRGCYLTMQQTGINTCKNNLELTVSDNRSSGMAPRETAAGA